MGVYSKRIIGVISLTDALVSGWRTEEADPLGGILGVQGKDGGLRDSGALLVTYSWTLGSHATLSLSHPLWARG